MDLARTQMKTGWITSASHVLKKKVFSVWQVVPGNTDMILQRSTEAIVPGRTRPSWLPGSKHWFAVTDHHREHNVVDRVFYLKENLSWPSYRGVTSQNLPSIVGHRPQAYIALSDLFVSLLTLQCPLTYVFFFCSKWTKSRNQILLSNRPSVQKTSDGNVNSFFIEYSK